MELPVKKLAEVCNKNYFVQKRVVYDSANFELFISHPNGQKIELKDLSSGEKQILSVFSHIYLGKATSNIILIDEPELSLSVDWQTSFLPDIAESGRCEFIAAVTHSPFIYENQFDGHAVDLAERVVTDK